MKRMLGAYLLMWLTGPGVPNPAQAWEPTKPVEFVVPAGPGGGADLMARAMARIVDRNKLARVPLIPVNKFGEGGLEGFLYVKEKRGDPHAILITLSSVFTAPLATGASFHWKEMTPLARLALDDFVLWVHADSPYQTARQYLDAVKRSPGKFKMGGTGANQEDRIITVQVEQAVGVKFTYVPLKSGGEVCASLVSKQVDSTVNNPAECAQSWKAGKVRPLGVFDVERMQWASGWGEIPTIREALGGDIYYLMLRGIFGPPDMPQEASEWYLKLLRTVYETKEFQDYLRDNALKAAWLTGPDFYGWLEQQDRLHRDLMTREGLVKK